jgi:dethiobiotin synthetase
MAKKIFITATGTDIGKTYISALIVKKLREMNYNCGYFKPVISGVTEMCGKLIDSDANYVVQTADIPTEAESCVSYWWKEAISPHLAAKRSNQEIDMTNDRIPYVIYMKVLENALHNNPNKNATIGDKESINKITKEDLYDCYNTFYHPSNMILTISGDVDPIEVLNQIKRNQENKNYSKVQHIKLPSYEDVHYSNDQF